MRHASLDIVFISIPTKCHAYNCNIKGDVLAQKIFMKIERFASLFLCIYSVHKIKYMLK